MRNSMPADEASELSFQFAGFEQAKEGHIVRHRYSDFAAFAQEMSALSGMTLPLPPKKMFGNTDKAFLQKRMQGLKHMLDLIAAHPILRLTLPFKRFLDPATYGRDFRNSAERGLFMFLRSEASWRVLEQLYGIGWRVTKMHATVLNQGYTSQDQSAPQLLTWVPIPATSFVPTELLNSVLKYIAGISHPFIAGASLGCVHGAEEPGAILVRALAPKGSLRDLIARNKNPKLPFARKYVGKKPKGLDVRTVRLFGRQILEALKFLHDRGLPYGHLHAGNVLVISDRFCQITDVENGVLGLPSLYSGHITELKKISTLELCDVYCFGQLLYEVTASVCVFGCVDVNMAKAQQQVGLIMARVMMQYRHVNMGQLHCSVHAY
ncbi:SLOB protein kinase [Salpingoeca rosetta]|uniref:SLOB protein kinase n=1 Tax=Salpingoeca rosetta (strain ATCC 50818 / BSB-021) TaxID=946362 RepID=F2UK95_SALR5|nr:SLOB protein kinase [Salpingoeca rosetta]EGD77544.1 SLOB protein kinase [Salpingoeca rosetta]|eukprot:XP_004990432.1 SLOB protein kinase [Salpingoeca rosetta]